MNRPLFRVNCVTKLQPGAGLHTLPNAASAKVCAVVTSRIWGVIVALTEKSALWESTNLRPDFRLDAGCVLVCKTIALRQIDAVPVEA